MTRIGVGVVIGVGLMAWSWAYAERHGWVSYTGPRGLAEGYRYGREQRRRR